MVRTPQSGLLDLLAREMLAGGMEVTLVGSRFNSCSPFGSG